MKTTTTMPETAELPLANAAPEVDAVEVQSLIAWLRGRGWVTARVIEAELRIDERKLRALAEHSDGEILSGPGCPGYRVFDGAATFDDADRAATRLVSQGKKMIRRAISIRRRAHRFGRAG